MSKMRDKLEKAGVPDATRHLFLCLGPDCCRMRDGEHTWDYIKSRIKHLDLKLMRTKAACFRICKEGPLMVVYPDGTWYSRVTPERFERILQEHLIGGTPVQEFLVATNSLCAPVPPPLEA
jgi:(2Fe-2S) ferredoxin